MREKWFYILLMGLFVTGFGPVHAREFVVQGQALVVDGDIGRARGVALQRALGVATALGSARISSLSESSIGSVSDSTRVTATMCTKGSRVLGETITEGQILLEVAVTLDSDPGCIPQCQPAYTNKVVVTGIPLEFPSQIEHLESLTPTLAYDTAVELARKLKNHNRLLVDHAESVFPYASATRAPEPFLVPGSKESGFSTLAKSRRAQYVVSGVYRDFALRNKWLGLSRERGIVIDVFIHDGANGALLAQRRFSTLAKGDVSLKGKPPIGSSAFYATDIGLAWGGLLDEIAHWTSETSACLPLIARILKIENNDIFIDVGAESGLKTDDIMRLHKWKEPPVSTPEGLLLGQEKLLGVELKLKRVYPGFAVITVTEAERKNGLKIRPDDLLYLQ